MRILAIILLPFLLVYVQLINNGECILASFLWQVVNTTIERKAPIREGDWNPSQCPRIIFYNNETLVEERELLGSKVVTIDLTGINQPNFKFPNLAHAKAFLDKHTTETIRTWVDSNPYTPLKRVRKLYEPCVTVVSVVNTTDMAFDKMWISEQLNQLLQYHTPVRNRHLILVRLADGYDELFNCNVFKGSKDFPTRRMPQWEMLLFDFFTDSRVIQGLAAEYENKAMNTLKVGNDPGLWVWMCDDIVEQLEEKKRCLAKGSDNCTIWNTVDDMSKRNCLTDTYSARH